MKPWFWIVNILNLLDEKHARGRRSSAAAAALTNWDMATGEGIRAGVARVSAHAEGVTGAYAPTALDRFPISRAKLVNERGIGRPRTALLAQFRPSYPLSPAPRDADRSCALSG